MSVVEHEATSLVEDELDFHSEEGEMFERGLGQMPSLHDLTVWTLPQVPPRAPRLELSDPSSGGFDSYPRSIAPTSRTASRSRWNRKIPNLPDGIYHGAPAVQPVHIVLTLSSTDTLRIGNVADPAIQSSLRTAFGSEWKEQIRQDAYSESEWIVKFRGRPWANTGTLAVLARRLICLIFTCLANQGWQYLSAVHTTSTTRHLFELSHADPGAHFFSISPSSSRRKLTAVDISQEMARSLIRHLRIYYGQNSIRERWEYSDTFRIELLESRLYDADEDIALLLGQILRATTEQGYRLDAVVPLHSSGLFGLGKRKEVWVFRRMGVITV